MPVISRRAFIVSGLATLCFPPWKATPQIMTVNGVIPASKLGKTLIHEHILVDFIGANQYDRQRWDINAVANKMLSYLLELKNYGVKSFFDCTPDFLGRDISLFKIIAEKTGLQIITNTGYYGAGNNKYLPAMAITASAAALSKGWIKEFTHGIEDTGVKPGFIKIGVDGDKPLSELHRKLAQAAALTHLKTGLTICSHTGKAAAAFEQIEILRTAGVLPSAFVWVHAQAETDKSLHLKAARLGCWVSLDGMGWGGTDDYVDSILRLKAAGLLHRSLISHDAGWYKPDEPDAAVTGYTNMFKEVIPKLSKSNFTTKDIDQLLIRNPAEAFAISIRRLY